MNPINPIIPLNAFTMIKTMGSEVWPKEENLNRG
jgi:hypothetical protein